jgi:hypothetical protein
MKNTAKSALAALMVALTLTAAPYKAAADGVRGESTDDRHKDWAQASFPATGRHFPLLTSPQSSCRFSCHFSKFMQ